MIGDAIERVRAHLAKPGITKTGLALKAELSPNALRDADQDDWNPSANTLRALEKAMGDAQSTPADTARAA